MRAGREAEGPGGDIDAYLKLAQDHLVMSSGKARYAQRDAGSKDVERWDLNTTRQLTHSWLREGGF